MKQFQPQNPWIKAHRQYAYISSDGVMPLLHAAEMMGIDKVTLEQLCKKYDIPSAARPPQSPEYSSYMDIKYFPALLRTLNWKEEDIQKGMYQLKNILLQMPKNLKFRLRPRPRNTILSGSYSGEEEEEEEEGVEGGVVEGGVVEKKESPSEPVRPKRSRGEEALLRIEARIDAKLEQMSAREEKQFEMIGKEAIEVYCASDAWPIEKQKALKAAVVQEWPELKKQTLKYMHEKYERIVEAEVREAKTRKLETNTNGEDMKIFRDVLHKKKMEAITSTIQNVAVETVSPPPPPLLVQEDEHDWIRALIDKEMQQQQTE